MRKYKYSNVLVNLVKKFLIDDDWHFSFDDNAGLFEFGLKTGSKIQKINYLIDVREEEIIVYGICPIGAECCDTDMMAQMAEFLCRANCGLKNGCFEFDFSDGEIRFKSFIDCEDTIPSDEVIKNSIYRTAAMYERYAPGIVDIIFSGRTAKEAITKCEKSQEDELRSMITEVIGEDMEGTDVEEMVARLVARFGTTEEEDSETIKDSSDPADEIHVKPLIEKKEGGAA